ncbi:MAG: hypothetical protein ACK46X_17660, partial [Candidatus Sericytochromatia bacterium]
MGPRHFRTIYARTNDGGVQLAASADRWVLHDDYVHLAPNYPAEGLMRYEAELKPFVDHPVRQALVIIDMQNDFILPAPLGRLPVPNAVQDAQRTIE